MRTIQIGADTQNPSINQIAATEREVNRWVTQAFGPLVSAVPTFTIASRPYALYLSRVDAQSQAEPVRIRILSASAAVISNHVRLLQGALPVQRSGAPFQFVLSEATAAAWHVTIGSTVYLDMPSARTTPQEPPSIFPVKVVGIATAQSDDPVLGSDFSSPAIMAGNPVYPVLGNLAAALALGAQTSSQTPTSETGDDNFSYYWTYQLDADPLQVAY